MGGDDSKAFGIRPKCSIDDDCHVHLLATYHTYVFFDFHPLNTDSCRDLITEDLEDAMERRIICRVPSTSSVVTTRLRL
jgi:hypothetical protein